MDSLVEFISLSDANVRYVALGSAILGASSAIVGCFTFLRKRSLVGDAVAHAVLPGVCLAFLMVETKNPLALIIGAFITAWLALVSIDVITSKTRIKEDAAIGLILSVFFGIGVLLLTSIQHSGMASQTGLNTFLFGKAAALVGNDVLAFGATALVLIVAVIAFFKDFSLLSFDKHFALAIGYPVRMLELLLTTLTVLAVVIGIQAVGVVLMAAMLITPAAAARSWTDRLPVMLVLAAVCGGGAGLVGAYISTVAPAMPTGPWIVMTVSAIAVVSLLIAPRRGMLARALQQRSNRLQILDENILKALFHMGEHDEQFLAARSLSAIQRQRRMLQKDLTRGLLRLRKQGYTLNAADSWSLTGEGLERGKRIVRLHRLWELYLTQYLRIAPDHVHEDAETIEHIITPELEKELEEILEYPAVDPHRRIIPQKS